MAGMRISGAGGMIPSERFFPSVGGITENATDVSGSAATVSGRSAGISASFSEEAIAGASRAEAEKATELTDEEKKEVEKLKRRDQEVRQHEQAHLSAAGSYARGGASFEYTSGPDGRRYATGGEVSLDVGPGRTPEETIQKARAIRGAALAPAEPSAQDRRVAAQAGRMETKARQELAEEKQKEMQDGKGEAAVSLTGAPGGNAAPQRPAPPEGIQRPSVSAIFNPENVRPGKSGLTGNSGLNPGVVNRRNSAPRPASPDPLQPDNGRSGGLSPKRLSPDAFSPGSMNPYGNIQRLDVMI